MSSPAINFRNASFFEEKEFYRVLSQIGFCCNQMMVDYQTIKIDNNENIIRNLLLDKYLEDNLLKQQLKINNYIFFGERPKINATFKESGYTDIEFATIKSYSLNCKASFVVECKRLDGKKKLNRKYIDQGIMRLVTNYYYQYYNLNGMIGFVVKAIDIDNCVEKINALIKSDYPATNTTKYLTKNIRINGFNNNYDSEHAVSSILISHLMVNFSEIIK